MKPYVVCACTLFIAVITYQLASWLIQSRNRAIPAAVSSPVANNIESTVTGSVPYVYVNNKYGFRFEYPPSVSIVTPSDVEPESCYQSDTPDSSSHIQAILGNEELEVIVYDPKDNITDFYNDPLGFWSRDLTAIVPDVYSLIQRNGSDVSAPDERNIGGEPAYWLLIKAINTSGTTQASVGWNGLGRLADDNTFIALTSHNRISYEIIVPDNDFWLGVMNTWHFSSSTIQGV